MSAYLRLLMTATLAILALACDDSPTAPGDAPIAFETVVATSSSGFVAPRREVIRDAEQWARAWDLLHARQGSVPPLPDVDFTRRMLVLAAMGSRNTGCFQVEVTAINLRRGAVEVEVMERAPTASCICTEALTEPVHVVSLDRVELDARFVVRGQSLSC
jgi:PrcB C-terminal